MRASRKIPYVEIKNSYPKFKRNCKKIFKSVVSRKCKIVPMRLKNNPNPISDYIARITDPTYVSHNFEMNHQPIRRAATRTAKNSR